MNAKQMCGTIVALCVAVVAARADTLELKNGSLIKGRFMLSRSRIIVSPTASVANDVLGRV